MRLKSPIQFTCLFHCPDGVFTVLSHPPYQQVHFSVAHSVAFKIILKMLGMDFRKEISNFLFIFNILSFGPVSSNITHDFFLQLHSFISIAVVCVSFFISPTYQYDTNAFHNAFNEIHYGTLLCCHLIIVVHAFSRRKSQLRILNRCSHIDDRLRSEFGVDTNYSGWRKRMWRFWMCFWTMELLIHLSYIYYRDREVGHLRSMFLRYYFSIFMIRLRGNQIQFYVQLLRTRLTWVKDCMQGIIEADADNPEVGSVFNDLLSLKEIYGKIYKTSIIFNDTFGWSILAVCIQNFVEFTREMFHLSRQLMVGAGAVDCFSVWFIVQIIELGLIHIHLAYGCYSCSLIVSQQHQRNRKNASWIWFLLIILISGGID